MSTADALIAGLVDNAEFDSEGAFSLDREKAREKMRQFQLSDPHRYVLLLIEAAMLRGATRIEFDIDADDMRLSFDAGLSWADLDELYAALFVKRSSDEIRARRELALAFNAVMALNPRWVRIESVSRDASGQPLGVAGSLRSDEADDIRKLDEPPKGPSDMQAWTRVHVKERFRPGLLVRFINDLGGSIPEEQLIRTRCRYASVPIMLDGVRVSEGFPQNLLAATEFSRGHLRGVAGISTDADRCERSAVVLLSNGVEICTHELGESVNGLWYWVDSSQFRKDVSQGDIVRSDDAYQEMLRAIGEARDLVLGRLAEMWAGGQFNESSTPTGATVFELLRKCVLAWADEQWLRRDAGPLGHLMCLPVWRTVDRRWLSPVTLIEEADKLRGVMYTERDFDGVMPRSWGPVVHVLDGQHEIDAILRVHPRAESATSRLEREVAWELNRRRWLARPHALELPRKFLRSHLAFEQDDYHGVVGLVPTQLSNVQFVVDGCLLSELSFTLPGLGIVAVVTGPIKPAADHERPRPDRSLATLALLVATQLPRLLELWARDGGADAASLKEALLGMIEADFLERWLTHFGFARPAAEQLLERLGRPSLLPPLGLEEGQTPTAVANLVRLATVDHRRPSLVEVAAARVRKRETGKVLYVDSSSPAVGFSEELIVSADANAKRLLLAVFGAAGLHDDTANYLSDLGRRNFEARALRSPTRPLTTWTVEVDLALDDGDRIHGHLGIDASAVRSWSAERPRKAKLELFTRGRSLCTIEEQSWLPGVEAEFVWEKAPLNREWTGIDGPTAPLRRALEVGIVELLRHYAERSEVRPIDDLRRLLWLAMTSPFISLEHFRAWRALRAHHGEDHEAAVADCHAVIELFPGVPLSELREAMTLLIDDGKPPTRDNLLALMGREIVPPGGGREFQRALLELYPVLECVPMVTLVSGESASLADMLAAFDATGEIAYVDNPALSFDDDEYVIMRGDEIDQVALVRLLGRAVFKEVSAWINERRSQQRFESREQIEELRVPDDQRLVAVEFEVEDLRGELAIPKWTTGSDGTMRITYCHQRRVIEELSLHAALPVIGIVDDPHAVLSADFSQVARDSPRMAAVRRVLDKVLSDQLLPELAARYEELGVQRKSIAWTWIAAHWRKFSPRAGQHPERLSAAGRAFAKLPLFKDVDGTPRTLEELIERAAEHRHLWTVERRPDHDVPAPFPILMVRSDQQATLAELFPGMRDFSDRWAARVEGHQRKLAAEAMPPLAAPDDAVHSIEVDRHGMKGMMWLPARSPFGGGVVLGAEGKFVEVQEFSDLLPALGVVGGELEADDLFREIQLSGPQRRYLESRVVSLYSGMLSLYEWELGRPETAKLGDPQQADRRGLRIEQLRTAAINTARAELEGRGFDAILRSLHQRLCAAPLLRLNSGKLISIDVARKARPLELAHLGVWDPNAPVVDVSEQARLLLGKEEPEAKPADPSASADAASEPEAKAEPETKPEPEPEPELSSEPEPIPDPSRDNQPLPTLEFEFAPEPKPEPEPATLIVHEPEPEPEPDPVAVLLDRIRDELRVLRERHAVTLSEGQLGAIHAEPGRGRDLVSIDKRVIFDSNHPRFVRALRDPDPMWVSFLASVAYTALNRWLEEVTDDDEEDFHAAHASLLLTALFESQ